MARRRRGARGREQLGGMARDSVADPVSLLFSPVGDDRLAVKRAGGNVAVNYVDSWRRHQRQPRIVHPDGLCHKAY